MIFSQNEGKNTPFLTQNRQKVAVFGKNVQFICLFLNKCMPFELGHIYIILFQRFDVSL